MSKLQEFHDRHAFTSVTNKSNNTQLPLSEVFRPRSFQDLMLPDETIRKFSKMIETDQIMNMIFSGRPGAGKTSAARLIAQNRETLCVNASNDTDLFFIKTTVSSYARTLALSLKQKIVILDEADFLTKNSQAALRALIEESYTNCRFIFIVNNINKIDPALISRCMPVCFDIKLTDIESMIFKYIKIIDQRLREHSIQIPKQALVQIVKIKFPDFRAIANEIEFAAM